MKKVSFVLLGIIILLLAITTFIGKSMGTGFVCQTIYGSWWFSLLWFLLASSACVYLLKRKLQRNFPVFLLHIAFVVILAGAFLTLLTARRGTLHLRMHEPTGAFVTDEKSIMEMPFVMVLDTFFITYYPGTYAPADYNSLVSAISDEGIAVRGQVAMNRVFSWQGFRFYQTSYDSDEKGTILTVNYDRWGIPVTYTGYFLLFTSMLWNLVTPGGYFRRALNSPLLKSGIFLFVLLSGSIQAYAAPRTLSKTDADDLGKVQVLYNGRIMPLQTLASDFTKKLTGRTTYKGYSSEQVFIGWMLFPSSWQTEPMIRIKESILRKSLNFTNEYVSFKDFFTSGHVYRLGPYLTESSGELKKSVIHADEKVQLISMLYGGELFKVFPVTIAGRTLWYAPASELPLELDNDQWLFIRKGMSLLAEAALRNESEEIRFLIAKIIAYQHKNGGESVLSETKVQAERFYNKISFPSLLYKINLIAGLLAFLFFGGMMFQVNGKERLAVVLSKSFVFLLYLSFLITTMGLLLRAYISGRLPMGNGYETMITMAWCILLIAIIFSKRFCLIISFGFLLSGFCLLVATIGQMNPQITPLLPVLSSSLLSLHVSFIMMSYALFAFIFFNGILALSGWGMQKEKQSKRLSVLSGVFLVPALFLLGIGIFIGAIWANISWGRYWAWDAKEVWALITFLVYALPLHLQSLPAFRKPRFFHAYMILAFSTVLMTYFGVNYFLGGLHSYAG